MIPGSFDYVRPKTLSEAVSLLGKNPEAKILAGGHSLIPMMRFRMATPPMLIDINQLSELAYIKEDGEWLRIGAMTREAELDRSELIRKRYPLLADTARVIADPLVRNLATIGGNIAHADPANDHPATMLAYGARVAATGPKGERTLEISDFFRGAFETALAAGEILTEIRIPQGPVPERRGLSEARKKSGRLRDGGGGGAALPRRKRQGGLGGNRAHERGPYADLRQGRVFFPRREESRRGRRGPGREARVGGRRADGRLSRVRGVQEAPRPHLDESRPDASPEAGGSRRRCRVSTHKISLKLNGESHAREVESRLLLVHFIREELNLTGTHIGCDTTSCGACTVILNGRPVKSCTVFAVQADGAEITTVEGLAQNGNLHPIQEGFMEKHGLQCGFCTPGMMMTSFALLKDNPSPTEEEIRWGISGNLCRCTGYVNIVKAVQYAAEKMKGESNG